MADELIMWSYLGRHGPPTLRETSSHFSGFIVYIKTSTYISLEFRTRLKKPALFFLVHYMVEEPTYFFLHFDCMLEDTN